MKFENIKEKQYTKQIDKNYKKYHSDNVTLISLYPNVAVYLMKIGTKGDFKYLSTLANNGKEATSWAIRIYFTSNKWTAQVAPHSEINKENITINMNDVIESLEDVEKFSTLHIATIKSEDKSNIEKAIQAIISKLQNIKISGIENISINKNYIYQYTTTPYKIIHSSITDHKSSNNKYIYLLKEIKKKNISDIEIKKINDLKESLNEENKKLILFLSQKYLTEAERIKIAMKFLF